MCLRSVVGVSGVERLQDTRVPSLCGGSEWGGGAAGCPRPTGTLPALECVLLCPANPFLGTDPAGRLAWVREGVSGRMSNTSLLLLEGKTGTDPEPPTWVAAGHSHAGGGGVLFLRLLSTGLANVRASDPRACGPRAQCFVLVGLVREPENLHF